MSATTTTLNGAVTASAVQITVTAYTAPAGRAKPLLKCEDEIMLITDNSLSPTLGVVRGYMGTLAAAHKSGTGLTYGAPADMQVGKGPTQAFSSLTSPTVFGNAQEVTATGTTGSNAATVTANPAGFLNVTGAANSGVNLPYPQVGAAYTIRNLTTGTIKVYCTESGATINGNAGATGFSLTATGNLTAFANCATAGAWQIGGNT